MNESQRERSSQAVPEAAAQELSLVRDKYITALKAMHDEVETVLAKYGLKYSDLERSRRNRLERVQRTLRNV